MAVHLFTKTWALSPWPAQQIPMTGDTMTSNPKWEPTVQRLARELGVEIVTQTSKVQALRVAEQTQNHDLVIKVDRLGQLAAARVEKEASGAPQSIKDEAVLRYAGYLYDLIPQAGFRSVDLGRLNQEFDLTAAPMAWRRCGAKALLMAWVVRRAAPHKDDG